MLTRDLISNSIPYLHKEDKVFHALQLMNDYHVAHLPVVENDSLVGLISVGDVVKFIIEEQKFIIENLEQYITH